MPEKMVKNYFLSLNTERMQAMYILCMQATGLDLM